MTQFVILGGAGFYGRHLVDDLVRRTDADVVVVDRKPAPDLASARVSVIRGDLDDELALRPVVVGADAIVQVAGPFSRLPVVPLRLALQHRIPYLDISEDLEWQRVAGDIAAGYQDPPVLAIGASVVPALMLSAVAHLAFGLDHVTSVRVVGAPDAHGRRGPGTYHTMLEAAGRPFLAPRNGRMQWLRGWSEPERVAFPPPVGERTAYLIAGRADRPQLQERYGVVNAEFKAALASPWLNGMMSLAAAAGRMSGRLPLRRLTPLAQIASRLVSLGADTGGAVIIEVSGVRDADCRREQLAVVAEAGCGRIPIAPLAIELGRFARGVSVLSPGMVDDWMPWTELAGELAARGLVVHRRSGDGPWEEDRIRRLAPI